MGNVQPNDPIQARTQHVQWQDALHIRRQAKRSCLYIGGDKAYERYKELGIQQSLAEKRARGVLIAII